MSSLKHEEKGDTLFVYLTDAKILDDATTHEIGKRLMDSVERAAHTAKRMAVDFRNVQFMSSAMIGKIILLNKKCKSSEVKLKLCNISPNVMEVFKLMRLNKVLDIQKDEEKALASFAKKGWFG